MPPLIFEPVTLLKNIYNMRDPFQAGSKELFMGKFENSSPIYFVVYLFITTPLLILGSFLLGLTKLRTRKFIFVTLAIWFFVPFIQSFYFRRINGIRYIVEIYAPLSIFAAVGIDILVKKFKEYSQVLFYLPIFIYLFISLFLISPYYLNYYNSLVGGAENVYKNKSFPLGWWGEGQREAVEHLVPQAFPGAVVGVYVVPASLLPPVGGLTFEPFQPKKNYDFFIVNYQALSLSHLDFSAVPSNYLPIYTVEAGGAPLVVVYKRIKQ